MSGRPHSRLLARSFLEDLKIEAEADIGRSLDAGAHCVQMDFTEGHLFLRLDPSCNLLRPFIDLNSQVLDPLTPAQPARIGCTPARAESSTKLMVRQSTTRAYCHCYSS